MVKNTKNSEKSKSVKKNTKNEVISSTVQCEKVKNGLINDAVKCKPKRVPKTPPHLPKLPLLAGAFGVCKSGKSNALVNLITEYIKHGSLNYVYCISPTYESNASLQTIPFVDERIDVGDGKKKGFVGIFTNPATSVQDLETITNHIKLKHQEYKDEKEYKRIYKLWREGKKMLLSFEELNHLRQQEYRKPIHVPWPQPGIFIDDMTHTELMANSVHSKLSHLSLHHRHLDGVGVSIFQAFQTFKSGMPRVVRTNISLIMLFSNMNMKEIEEIYAEVCNNITFETFKKLLFEATKEEHGFLLVNKMADDCTRQFGKNFNQVFVVDPVEERRKLLGV